MQPPVPDPPPALKARGTARQRALRNERLLERMQEGWSYESIASAERLSVSHVRDIVARALRRREPDGANEHMRLQRLRLAPSLRVAAEAIAAGDLRAIDRMLRLLDRLDRYNSADIVTEEDREDLFRKLKEQIDRRSRKYDLEREREERRFRNALARLAALGIDEESATADPPEGGSAPGDPQAPAPAPIFAGESAAPAPSPGGASGWEAWRLPRERPNA